MGHAVARPRRAVTLLNAWREIDEERGGVGQAGDAEHGHYFFAGTCVFGGCSGTSTPLSAVAECTHSSNHVCMRPSNLSKMAVAPTRYQAVSEKIARIGIVHDEAARFIESEIALGVLLDGVPSDCQRFRDILACQRVRNAGRSAGHRARWIRATKPIERTNSVTRGGRTFGQLSETPTRVRLLHSSQRDLGSRSNTDNQRALHRRGGCHRNMQGEGERTKLLADTHADVYADAKRSA